MPGMADGLLASAVAQAGGLGMIGVGQRDAGWIAAQFGAAGREKVGCGFLTSHLAQSPELLDLALSRQPRAIFLTHGDPRPFAPRIAQAQIPLICQVQSLEGAALAVDAGADVIVAQGGSATGPTGVRTTLALLPEVADFLHREAHDTVLLAAGGIADSRGLAACLVMGADGVVIGTRLWASVEGRVSDTQMQQALRATGDDTIQTLQSDTGCSEPIATRYLANTRSTCPAGEGIGLIRDFPPVADILNTLTDRAGRLMIHAQRKVIP